MLKIVYAPENGYVVPDNKMMDYVEKVIQYYNSSKEMPCELLIGSELMLSAFRVAVKRKLISCEEIVFEFDGDSIPVDSDGRYKFAIPDVAADLILDELLGYPYLARGEENET
jgi:hypothetical protein